MYDLEVSSCVSSEVKVFNSKVQRKMEIFDHVVLVDVELSKEHFTQHGRHKFFWKGENCKRDFRCDKNNPNKNTEGKAHHPDMKGKNLMTTTEQKTN
jgi:hypothetical protein